jgi:hypothetical protein
MKRRGRRPEEEAAFVMEASDRFHRIIVSDGVRYEKDQDAETVITFFLIRRASGGFDVVNVNKTFKGKRCVSRTVQGKKGVPASRIADEIDAVRIGFALGIEKATGYKLKWHELDLSDVQDQAEQVARIRAWGRVGVRMEANGAAWN